MLRNLFTVFVLLLSLCSIKVRASCPFARSASPALPNTDGSKKTAKTEKQRIEEQIRAVISGSDENKDNKSSEEELRNWTQESLMSVHKRDAMVRLKTLDTNKDGKVTWEEFLKSKEDIGVSTEEQKKKRFDQADADKDGGLMADEFISMFHPEETPHMFDVVIDEYMERGDGDKDGLISFEEYISKMLKKNVANQKVAKQFFNQQDKDEDGNISRDELKLWIESISSASRAKKEAQLLLHTADDDKDGLLTEEEMINHVNLFLKKKRMEDLEKAENDRKAKNTVGEQNKEKVDENAKEKSKDEL